MTTHPATTDDPTSSALAVLDYLAHHPSSAPTFATAALIIANRMGTAPDWDGAADWLEEIATWLTGAGSTFGLPCVGDECDAWQGLTDPATALPTPPSPERFLVTWTIDIDPADLDDPSNITPAHVARAALDALTRPESSVHVFTVHDNLTRTITQIDLDPS